MLAVLLLLIGGLLLAAIMIRPFLGVLMLWPVLLLYPHALTEGLLPFNIGFDDIFVTFVFIVTVGRRLLSGEVRFGKWGMLVLGYWLLLVFSSFYGLMYENVYGGIGLIIRDLAKRSTIVMVAFIVLNGLDDIDQIPRVVRYFLIAAIGLSILAIVQSFYPQVIAPFYQMEDTTPGERLWRVTGTTRGPWEIGGVLGISLIMAMAFLTLARGLVSKTVSIACAALSAIAIVMSLSRSGWLFVVAGVSAILFFGKKPIRAVVMIAIVGLVFVFFPLLAEMVSERVEQTGTLSSLGSSASWRIEIWKTMLSGLDLGTIGIGVGRLGSFARYGHSAHSYYVAIIAQTGLIGVLYFIILGFSLWRRTWDHIRTEEDPLLLTIWKGIFAINFGVLFYSLTVETLDVDLVAKAMFFFWPLLYMHRYLVGEAAYEEYDDEFIYDDEYAVADGIAYQR
ncbi:MAG: O-antigen ligase family protein [Sedimentisphaerales bacterium]|nr:O-antigen ligase family protein [Sedimentisphaerales bacterium]